MNIIFLTPGTGNFYCGSCIRDKSLAKALIAQGHEVSILPLYLPFMTDGEPSTDEVHLGGLNLFLIEHLSWLKKLPSFFDRWTHHPTFLRWLSRFAGMTKASELGRMTLSMLKGEEGRLGEEMNKIIPVIQSKMAPPDVIVLSNALLMGLASGLKRELGCAIFCTLQGEDGFIDALPEPFKQNSWNQLKASLDQVDVFLPVSRYHANIMKDRMSIPEEKLRVCYNGFEVKGSGPVKWDGQNPVLGYLARLAPYKGLLELSEAFIALKQKNKTPHLKLAIAGTYTSLDEPFIKKIKQKLSVYIQSGEVVFSENISEKEKDGWFEKLTVFSVPANKSESFGLYILEAWARGIPVVQPDQYAFSEILSEGGGGLFEAKNMEAYVQSLESLLSDHSLRNRLGEKGWAALKGRFNIAHQAKQLVEVLNDVLQKKI